MHKAAPEVEELATKLISAYHPHLTNAIFVYAFTDKPIRKGGHEVIARVKRLTGLAAYLAIKSKAAAADAPIAQYEETVFAIEVVQPKWEGLDENARHATIDHELSHVRPGPKGKLKLVSHTIEEFGGILLRWGFYLPDRLAFGALCVQRWLADGRSTEGLDEIVALLGETAAPSQADLKEGGPAGRESGDQREPAHASPEPGRDVLAA
jgi:hypothetical protein